MRARDLVLQQSTLVIAPSTVAQGLAMPLVPEDRLLRRLLLSLGVRDDTLVRNSIDLAGGVVDRAGRRDSFDTMARYF